MPTMICAGCGHANGPDARFCEECGSSLALRCPSCGAEVSATARFCSSCGSEIAPEQPTTGALKVVSVVFSDVVGSTELQEKLEAESVRRVMARFYQSMREVVERHGGAIQKFIGDAVVAVFGVPSVGEDDALRAARCAAAMAAALEDLNDELEQTWGVRLQIRTGVNTGELAISDEGIFVGDTMNTAARLEQAAGTGEVLLGEATWRLVRHEVEVEEIAALEAKGKRTPLRAWRVVSTEPRSAAAAEAPLVGRASELERLRSALEQAITARACRLVTVIGSPGLGKSRLAAEFARSLEGQATVLEGHCEHSGEGITFLPVAEVLRAAASIADDDPPEQVVAKLTHTVPDGPDRERIVARVAGLLGAGPAAAPEETFWGVRAVLESLAREHPLVVVLDDVHWGQPMFLDLIEHLVEWARDAAILLVALARPELRETRGAFTAAGRRAADVIELDPLGPDQSRELVAGLLGQVDLPDALLARILETTEGNPLFLGELLRMLVEEGSLERAGDVWVAAGGAEAVQVPPTIQALLTARIERLRADERSVVERAAVIGKQFYRGAVAELVAPPVRSDIDGHLETLRRKDMVEPEGTYWIDEPVYRFHHVLIRDAAYHLLLKEARAELHEKFSDWLETKAGDLVGEHEEVIAYHLEQAHEYRRQLGPLDERGKALGARAAERLASAGRRALAREDLAAAANLLQRALDREAGVNEDEMRWHLSEALISAGDTAGVAPVVERLAGPRGDVLEAQLAVLTGTGSLKETLERVTAATSALAAAGDDAAAAKGHHVTAQVQAQLGRVADVETSLDHALLAARKADDRRRITAVLAAAPRAALWGPSPVVRASGRCLDVVRILRMTPGNRHVEAVALRCQAVLEAMRGRADAAREILAGGRATLEELGLTLELHELAMHEGIVELLAGQPARAEGLLRRAREGFGALGVSVSAAQAAALLARALVEQARDEEALGETDYAEEHAGGDLKTTITWLGVRAEAIARRGETDEALALARRAAALADPTDALADKADANMALARVLREADRTDEARSAAGVARALYQQKDHAVGVQLAGELASGAARTPSVQPADRAAVLSDTELAEHFALYVGYWEAHDAEGLAALYADDYVTIDHREVGWGERSGHEANVEWVRSAMALAPDLRISLDKVIASEPGVFAICATWHGHSAETGGEAAISMGRVTTVRDGLITRVEIFEPDAEISMRACFEDLRGRMLLGERPPEQTTRAFVEAYARHDGTAVKSTWSEDSVLIDHRALGWEGVSGHEARMQITESVWSISPDIRMCVDEVLACDERVIALRVRWMGTGEDGGGVIEVPLGYVNVVEDGRVVRTEQFDPDDREAMLARYRELGGTTGVLGDRPPERVWSEFKRRFNARDLDGLLGLYAGDWTFSDHRQLGYEMPAGVASVAENFRSVFAASPDIRVEVETVIACDERVIALEHTYRGTNPAAAGGEGELRWVVVTVVEDGLIRSTDLFDPEDRLAVMARWRELHGLGLLGRRPSERLLASWIDCYGRRDIEGLEQVLDEDYVLVDRRPMAWEEQDHGELLETVRSAWAMSRVLRQAIDEVVACDERLWAGRLTYIGEALDGGGEGELSLGLVLEFSDTGVRRCEQFERDDTEGMLARYRELGGQMPEPGERSSERVIEQLRQAQNERDYERLAELVTDDWYMVDHRALAWPESHGRERCIADLRSVYDASPDVRLEYEEVLAADDNVAVTLNAWRGRGLKAGEHETRAGAVHLIRDGRWAGVDFYEADDRQAMIARYVELGGGLSAVGESNPEKILAEWCRRYARRKLEGLLEMLDEGFQWTDHRMLGWDPFDREGFTAVTKSAWEEAADIRIEADEVLAADERTLAVRLRFVGHALDGGGAFELPVGQVCLYRDGRAVLVDQYDAEDREGVLTRFAELTGSAVVLGDRPPERVWARYISSFNASDFDALEEILAPDYAFEDHRTLGYEPARGIEGGIGMLRSARSASADLRIEAEEVLACDERVIALLVTWLGHGVKAGELELPMGVVAVVEQDRLKVHELFNPDDRAAILARYVELGGRTASALGDRASERVVAEIRRVLNERDYERFAELLTDDSHWVDHRALGWEEVHGREQCVEVMRSAFDPSPNVRLEYGEVLACDDNVIAMHTTWRGRGLKAGELEVEAGAVYLVRDGRWASLDVYEPDDRAAIIARYAELGGGAGALGDRPPEQFFRRWIPVAAAGDIDGVAQLVAEDFVRIDHRSLGWEPLRDREANLAMWRSAYESAEHVRMEAEEVLACDDRVIAWRFSWCGLAGGAAGGGEFAVSVGQVNVIEDGIWRSCDQYDTNDRVAMIARYVELGGGLGKLGDTTSERLFAEYARRYTSRDYDGVLAMMSEDYVQVDHRNLGWVEIGKEQNAAEIRSVWGGTTDIRPEVEEVLAADDRVLACICTYHGSVDATAGGGQFEYPVGFLLVSDGERSSRVEWFDADDREAILARYAELSAPPGTAERLVREYLHVVETRDLDALRQLMSDEIQVADHRPVAAPPGSGPDAALALARSALQVTSDLRFKVDHVVAGDARTVGLRGSWVGTASDGEGELALPMALVVGVAGEHVASLDLYEYDDLEAVRARFAEVAAGPAARAMLRFAELLNVREWPELRSLFGDNFALVDHRPMPWEDVMGGDQIIAICQETLALSSDARLGVEILDDDGGNVVACRQTWSGTFGGGGSAELVVDGVMVLHDDQFIRADLFNPDQSAAMQARLAELRASN
jgi:class 3 adenylate cyclase/ketosteroid isomerase-like protein